MPHTSDARIDALADVYARVSDSLADLLAEMLVTTSASNRLRLHREVFRRLQELDSQTQAWIASFAGAMIEDEGDQLWVFLLSLGLSRTSHDRIVGESRKNTGRQIAVDLAAAIASVRALAASAATGTFPEALRTLVEAARASSGDAIRLRKEIRQKLVAIIAADGRMIRFEPSYYASLSAFMQIGLAAQEIVKAAAQKAGFDLVRISPNPSTIGDFCDMYRGKVFSLSGTHPVVPPLSVVPSGNVPMHPWCHHRLLPYDERGKTPDELRAVSGLPQSFLDAASRGASTNDFEKLWRSSFRSR